MMMQEEDAHGEQEGYLEVLANAVSHVANESIILAQFEVWIAEEVPKLNWLPDDKFEERMNQVAEHLGSPPEHVIVPKGYEAPPFDHYPVSILRETLNTFQRARKSVVRAHMFMVGARVLNDKPSLLDFPDSAAAGEVLTKSANDAFWEHAEAAYIRLASFWDRVGQVLDFAYFNTRQYDRQGFDAVMHRIHTNAIQMNPVLAASSDWKLMRSFQNSNKDDGLQWLLSRRNTVVHSLHLHPIKDNSAVLKAQYNHFEAAHMNRLMPRSPEAEVAQLTLQLSKASLLFKSFLRVVEHSPSRKIKAFYSKSDLAGYRKRD